MTVFSVLIVFSRHSGAQRRLSLSWASWKKTIKTVKTVISFVFSIKKQSENLFWQSEHRKNSRKQSRGPIPRNFLVRVTLGWLVMFWLFCPIRCSTLSIMRSETMATLLKSPGIWHRFCFRLFFRSSDCPKRISDCFFIGIIKEMTVFTVLTVFFQLAHDSDKRRWAPECLEKPSKQ